MFFSLWRKLRNPNPGPSGGKRFRGGRPAPYRPRLEPLEDRVLPALGAGMVPPLAAGGAAPAAAAAPTPRPAGAPAQGAGSGLQPIGHQPPGGTHQMSVTVVQNSPESVIELGAVFAAMPGIQHEDGLQLSVLGNTNSGLVQADLSEAELTLNYAPWKCGQATITVGATDADGVSVQENILVTVLPPKPAGAGGVSPTLDGAEVSRAALASG
jgi:hypothetical protein